MLTDLRPELDVIHAVARAISVPRARPANSFVLHAPLELIARAGLSKRVSEAARPEARRRLAEIIEQWEEFGPAVADPAPTRVPGDLVAARRLLEGALEAGDLDDVDAAAVALARLADPAALARALADLVLPRTSAAAHAPIFLYSYPAVAPQGEISAAIVRPLLRELARYPDWRIRWTADLDPVAADAGGLASAIAATPRVRHDGSNFVHPTMMRVDESGIAARVLRDVIPRGDLVGARRAILRAAARTMLAEPDDNAPYGWSHAFTMPQGALAIAPLAAEASQAIAVAATYLVGFRASESIRPLPSVFDPTDPQIGWRDSFQYGSNVAAASVWHTSEAELEAVADELATRAAVHPDAHLAKYTFACIEEARVDRDARRLYLAACAHLHGVWRGVDRP